MPMEPISNSRPRLSVQWNVGSYSGMNEKPILVANMKRRRSYPREVLRREIGGVIYVVGIQCLLAAVRPPLNEVSIGAIPIRGKAKHLM